MQDEDSLIKNFLLIIIQLNTPNLDLKDKLVLCARAAIRFCKSPWLELEEGFLYLLIKRKNTFIGKHLQSIAM